MFVSARCKKWLVGGVAIVGVGVIGGMWWIQEQASQKIPAPLVLPVPRSQNVKATVPLTPPEKSVPKGKEEPVAPDSVPLEKEPAVPVNVPPVKSPADPVSPPPVRSPVASAPVSAPLPSPPVAPVQIPSSVPVSGRLAVLTALRAEIEEAKMNTTLAELVSKHTQLLSPASQQVDLETLVLPVLPQESAKSMGSGAATGKRMQVISVQGVAGNVSATVRNTSGKIVTLRVGSSFAGGTVSAISRQGVQVKRGKTLQTVSFE